MNGVYIHPSKYYLFFNILLGKCFNNSIKIVKNYKNIFGWVKDYFTHSKIIYSPTIFF